MYYMKHFLKNACVVRNEIRILILERIPNVILHVAINNPDPEVGYIEESFRGEIFGGQWEDLFDRS